MAHAALHFTAGMVAGMTVLTPLLHKNWQSRRRLAPAVMRWLLASWGAGIWAIIPSLLRYAGFPDSCNGGWWMNLFMFHPLIDQHGPHATIIGAALLVGTFSVQYTVIIVAIIRTRGRSSTEHFQ